MLTVTIDTGNAAFDGYFKGIELHRILRKLAEDLRGLNDDDISLNVTLIDANGNKVGEAKYTREED